MHFYFWLFVIVILFLVCSCWWFAVVCYSIVCYVVRDNVCDSIVYDILHDIVLFHTWFLTLCCFWMLFVVRCCLSVILLSNLAGKKRKHNGYYDKSSLKKEMDISRNEVNMAKYWFKMTRGNNLACVVDTVSQIFLIVCHPESSNILAK